MCRSYHGFLVPNRYDLAASAKTAEVIRPCLHHLAPLGAIVCCTDFVTFGVGQLQLDDVRREALLIQTRRCERPESVSGHFFARITQSPERRIDRVF